MKKLFLPLLIVGLLVSMVLVVGCGTTSTNTGSGTTGTSAAATTETSDEGALGTTETSEGQEGEEARDEATVDIRDFRFSPETVTIKRGGRVTWTNRDSVGHTATGDDNEFDSGILNNGQSYTQTFNEVGQFNYHCTPHPQMRATVIVQE